MFPQKPVSRGAALGKPRLKKSASLGHNAGFSPRRRKTRCWVLCLLLPTIVTVMTLAIFTPISPEDELTPKAGTDSFSPGHFKAIVLNHQKSIRNSASQLLGKFRIRGGDAVPSFGGIRTGADPERLKSGQGAEKVPVDPLNMEAYVDNEKHGSEADEQTDLHGKVILEPSLKDQDDLEDMEVRLRCPRAPQLQR
eukprot:9272307-Pyramimonas_sp.AAC.2